MAQQERDGEPARPARPGNNGIGPSRLRDHNERVVLATVRDNAPIPSAEIARLTGLSAQTASVITRSLEADGLLVKGDPQRGRVGKPSIPVMLNPDGALAFGMRLGRRGATMVLIDLAGKVRAERRLAYAYPTPAIIRQFAAAAVDGIAAELPAAVNAAIIGLGIAAPFELWKWLDAVNAPKDEMLRWRDHDFVQDFATFTDLPVTVANDTTMACSGERAFGVGRELRDFLYFYIGAFIGGGLVMGGQVVFGRSGNAAAFGSIPVGDTTRPGHQLIHNASIHTLETAIKEARGETVQLWGEARAWSRHADLVEAWIARTAASVAQAIVAATAVVDIPTVVVDGGMPGDIKATLIDSISAQIDRLETEGIDTPRLVSGRLGLTAGAIGAAYQPIQAAHFPMAAGPAFG